MTTHLTVNASRFVVTNEDLVNYTGNPLVAPLGRVRTGYTPDLSTLTMAGMGNPAAMLRPRGGINMMGLNGGLNQAPIMWLTTDGAFVFNKGHDHVAVLPLSAHLDVIKAAYPQGTDIKIVSMTDAGNTYINMYGGDVVTFEEVPQQPVHFKRDESGRWVGWNRIDAEWDEVHLHLCVDGQFRIEPIDLVHLTLTDHNGEEIYIHLDSQGLIHEVEGCHRDTHERVQLSEFELSDDNPVFKYLIPEDWEATAPVKTKPLKNLVDLGALHSGPSSIC